MEIREHDLVVVGAGSGGYAAARTARELGADVALVDRGPLGGLCILRGCMPSKALLASSDAAAQMREAGELGVHAGGVTVDFPHVMRRKRELVAGFAEYRVEGIREFTLYEGPARFAGAHELGVGDGLLLRARKFIIATGSSIAPAVVPGLVETGFVDSDAALEIAGAPASLVVLGGGYIGCELGQFFSRMGTRTTIVLRSRHLLSGEDDDVGDALTEYFRAEGIDVRTQTRIHRVSRRGTKKVVHVERDGQPAEIGADEILYCLGRVPNLEGLGLENVGIPVHPVTGIEVDEMLRTSNPDVYAVGDVTGRHMLVHVAIYEGEVAARNAVSGAGERVDYTLQTAHAVFSDPQVAVVGATERELRARGVAYVRGRYDFAEHGKAMSLNRTKGFVKMLAAADSGKILGAAVLGSEGSDLIHEVIVAMQYGATVQEFVRIPHLHPTMAEIWTYPAQECADRLEESPPAYAQAEAALGGIRR